MTHEYIDRPAWNQVRNHKKKEISKHKNTKHRKHKKHKQKKQKKTKNRKAQKIQKNRKQPKHNKYIKQRKQKIENKQTKCKYACLTQCYPAPSVCDFQDMGQQTR